MILIEPFMYKKSTADLHKLATECETIVLANGFEPANWETAVRKVAYIFTEIDEAIDAVNGSGHDPLEEEIADIAIRLLSLLSGIAGENWCDRVTGRKPYTRQIPFQKIESLLLPIFSHCAKALECWRKNNERDFISHIELGLKETFDLADLLEIDLFGAILVKNEKNRARGLRHGKDNEKA
jgi:NTP pyrophosphatase (non-canonical NTP hydrolase)